VHAGRDPIPAIPAGCVGYRATFHTSDVKDGQLERSALYFILRGDKGQSATVKFAEEGFTFNRGSATPLYFFIHQDVGAVQRLEMWHLPKAGATVRWHVSHVNLVPTQTPDRAATFVYDQYLEGGKRVKLDALSAKRHVYKVVVHTSDLADAGTDAPVSLFLYGSKAVSEEIELKQPLRDDFEKGQNDEFFLDLGATDLGEIEAIDIGFYDRKKGVLERVKSSLGEDW
jgi:hypothetical protein